MKIAYFDCPMGVSGDMLLGALIDTGLEGEQLIEALSGLDLPGYALRWKRVMKESLAATQVTIEVSEKMTERRLADVESLLDAATIPDELRQDAKAIFLRLAEVEAGIHGTTPESVHFHELGAIDTLVDIVGVLWGLKLLGVDKVYASALPVAPGWTQSLHGSIPLPAPATLSLLRDVPLIPAPVEGELVTPTGAALLTHLAEKFGPPPSMILRTVGYGAGNKDFSRPNILRLWLGEMAEDITLEHLLKLETNIDDMNPQIYEHVSEMLFSAGALDVTLAPVQMKKNRPGTLLSVLCQPGHADALSRIIFSETTTLGIRHIPVTRQCLPRRLEQVETPYGVLQVKVAVLPDGTERVMPEYEDCRRLARETGVPLRVVMDAAKQAL